MKKNIEALLNLGITNYRIHKNTDVAESTLSDLKKDKSKIGNLKLDHALSLNSYYKKIIKDVETMIDTRQYKIQLEIMTVLRERIENLMFKVTNPEDDKLEVLKNEINHRINETILNGGKPEDVKYLETTGTNETQTLFVKLLLEVDIETIIENEFYKVTVKNIELN